MDATEYALARLATDPALQPIYAWLQARQRKHFDRWCSEGPVPEDLRGRSQEIREILQEIDAAVQLTRHSI